MLLLLFTGLVIGHGLVHLIGPAKAFGFAAVPQLSQPIGPGMGMVWLVAALLMIASGASIWLTPRWWWAVALAAVALSQVAILVSWTDARFGTIANAIVALGAVAGLLAWGPGSLRAQYDADVAAGLRRTQPTPTVTDDDLAHLPAAVARYLRVAGVVGRPKVANVRARMHGRIRGGPNEPWMAFTAEQHNFFDRPSRFFYMTASRAGLPLQGYHRFTGEAATMLVKLAGAVPVARSAGAAMTRAETVTLLNDMCLLAPATLVDRAIEWAPIDDRTVRATFTHAGHTIAADLVFDPRGQLVDFRSSDRRQLSTDGTSLRPARWSTPLRDHRTFGAFQLASGGEGLWHEPDGTYAYIEITIDDVAYNLTER